MTATENEGWKQVFFSEPKNIEELRANFNYWLYLTDNDREAVEVVLAAALDRDIPGDPFWLYVISPSGGIKTEIIRALSKYDKAYTLDSLTPATFVSGKVEKDKETGDMYPVAGILESINGKVLIIKDFTVVLSSPDIARTEIYGQLRAIHDGYFEKAFGTLPDPIRVESKIGLIAAVTGAIDLYTKAHSILGERLLKLRLHPKTTETTMKAYENLGKEEKLREDLTTTTAYYLRHVRTTRPYPKPSGEQMRALTKISRYIALMRTHVISRYFQGQIVNMDFTEPEVPTRVVKQLKKLAIGLAVVRQHDEVTADDMKTVKRVAKDCSLPVRQKIVESLATFLDKSVLAFQIQHDTRLPLNTVQNELKKMALLGIVEEQFPLEEGRGEDKPKSSPPFYSFSREFEELYESCK